MHLAFSIELIYNSRVNKLYVKNETPFAFEYQPLFEQVLHYVSEQEKLSLPTEVNLVIVSNAKMRRISQQYRFVNKATDVLSFPANYQELRKILGYNMLGDIYIAHEQIATQASAYQHSLKREWAYIFTHGLYHLLGYDHHKHSEETIMNNKVAAIMKKIRV